MPHKQPAKEEDTQEFKDRTGFDKSDRDAVRAVMRSTWVWRVLMGLGVGWTAIGHQFAGGEAYVKEVDFQRLERKVDKIMDREEQSNATTSATLNELSKEIFQMEQEVRVAK